MESTDLLVVGCGPAGGTAAREAARAGVATVVLERDADVGARRVCAAGLRPGFCEAFDLPRSIVHCDPPTITCTTPVRTYAYATLGTAHTTTREELDGTIAELARTEGADIRTRTLFRGLQRDGDGIVVEYADTAAGGRKEIRAKTVFLAHGSTARIDDGIDPRLNDPAFAAGLLTCFQYRVYPERPAVPAAYEVLEMHYFTSSVSGRPLIAWMFPKRDHLSIGLGLQGKIAGSALRAELDAFVATVAARLFPESGYRVREEGNLLYGGAPRPGIAADGVLVGGTAAGLVDATTGEGIYEAAMTGRFAAAAAADVRRGRVTDAAPSYARATKRAFHARLRHRYKLMNFLERRPARFDVLFELLETDKRFADLLQRETRQYAPAEWMYLYGRAAKFSLRALRV